MTAFYIMLSSLFELTAIILLLWGFAHEEKVVKWEQKQWKKFKRWLRTQLRKNPRIVAWAEKPSKNGGDA